MGLVIISVEGLISGLRAGPGIASFRRTLWLCFHDRGSLLQSPPCSAFKAGTTQQNGSIQAVLLLNTNELPASLL